MQAIKSAYGYKRYGKVYNYKAKDPVNKSKQIENTFPV